MKEKMELGKSYLFQIILFEPAEQRLILDFLDEKTPTTATTEQ